MNRKLYIREMEHLGKGKFHLSFDNGESCVVYGSEIRGLHLEAGAELDWENYEYLMTEVIGKRAKKRALYLLERMDRTEKQLRDKLAMSGYPAGGIEDAIEYVKSFHYLDDTRYALNYTRYSKETLSRGQIKRKLMSKGISGELASRVVEDEYDTDEAIHIRKLLEKKHFDSFGDDTGEFRRMYQYLLRRGYQSSDILREMKAFGAYREDC